MPRAPSPLKPWQVGVVFLAAVGLELIVGGVVWLVVLAAAAIAGADPGAWLGSPALLVIQVLAGSGGLAALALVAARLRGIGARDGLGLRAPRFGALALGALGVLPVGILSDELTYAVGLLAPRLFDGGNLEQFAAIFARAPGPWFAALAAAIAVGPALGEELLFRGLLQGSLAARLPRGLAVLLTAILFGALHFDAAQGLGALLIGLYLGLVALATGSLWPAIAAHAVNNLLCALLARFDPAGAGTAFDSGHPWPLVAAAAAAAAAVIAALVRTGAGPRPRSAHSS